MKKAIFLLFLSFSCKTENKTKVINESTLSGTQIEVVINAKVLVNDVFEVYYYEAGQKTFQPKDFVYKEVIGDSAFQDIIFNLPQSTYPERLRLDFGKNANQEEIILNSISLSYNSKVYRFSDEEIENEFKPSKYMNFDPDTYKLKTIMIDGKYDPYFYTNKVSSIVNYLLED